MGIHVMGKKYHQDRASAAKCAQQDSVYQETGGEDSGRRDPLEEYLEKWAQAKKQQQEILDERMGKVSRCGDGERHGGKKFYIPK